MYIDFVLHLHSNVNGKNPRRTNGSNIKSNNIRCDIDNNSISIAILKSDIHSRLEPAEKVANSTSQIETETEEKENVRTTLS